MDDDDKDSDKDNRDSSDQREELTVEELRRRRIARMLQNQQRYMEMCHASANLLQMLSRIAPGVTDDLQVEDADDSLTSSSSEEDEEEEEEDEEGEEEEGSSPELSMEGLRAAGFMWEDKIITCRLGAVSDNIRRIPPRTGQSSTQWQSPAQRIATRRQANSGEGPAADPSATVDSQTHRRASPTNTFSLEHPKQPSETVAVDSAKTSSDDPAQESNATTPKSDSDPLVKDAAQTSSGSQGNRIKVEGIVETEGEASKSEVCTSETTDAPKLETDTSDSTTTSSQIKLSFSDNAPSTKQQGKPNDDTQFSQTATTQTNSLLEHLASVDANTERPKPSVDVCEATRQGIQRAMEEMARVADTIRQAREALGTFRALHHLAGGDGANQQPRRSTDDDMPAHENTREENAVDATTAATVPQSAQSPRRIQVAESGEKSKTSTVNGAKCSGVTNSPVTRNNSTLGATPRPINVRVAQRLADHNSTLRFPHMPTGNAPRLLTSLTQPGPQANIRSRIPTWSSHLTPRPLFPRRQGFLARGLAKLRAQSQARSDETNQKTQQTIGIGATPSAEPVPVDCVPVCHSNTSNNKNDAGEKVYVMPELDIPIRAPNPPHPNSRGKKTHKITTTELGHALQIASLFLNRDTPTPERVNYTVDPCEVSTENELSRSEIDSDSRMRTCNQFIDENAHARPSTRNTEDNVHGTTHENTNTQVTEQDLSQTVCAALQTPGTDIVDRPAMQEHARVTVRKDGVCVIKVQEKTYTGAKGDQAVQDKTDATSANISKDLAETTLPCGKDACQVNCGNLTPVNITNNKLEASPSSYPSERYSGNLLDGRVVDATKTPALREITVNRPRNHPIFSPTKSPTHPAQDGDHNAIKPARTATPRDEEGALKAASPELTSGDSIKKPNFQEAPPHPGEKIEIVNDEYPESKWWQDRTPDGSLERAKLVDKDLDDQHEHGPDSGTMSDVESLCTFNETKQGLTDIIETDSKECTDKSQRDTDEVKANHDVESVPGLHCTTNDSEAAEKPTYVPPNENQSLHGDDCPAICSGLTIACEKKDQPPCEGETLIVEHKTSNVPDVSARSSEHDVFSTVGTPITVAEELPMRPPFWNELEKKLSDLSKEKESVEVKPRSKNIINHTPSTSMGFVTVKDMSAGNSCRSLPGSGLPKFPKRSFMCRDDAELQELISARDGNASLLQTVNNLQNEAQPLRDTRICLVAATDLLETRKKDATGHSEIPRTQSSPLASSEPVEDSVEEIIFPKEIPKGKDAKQSIGESALSRPEGRGDGGTDDEKELGRTKSTPGLVQRFRNIFRGCIPPKDK